MDGIIFEIQAHGGVSRVFAEILPRMCELSTDIQFTLLTAGRLKQSLPSHARVHHLSRPGVQRLFQGAWLAKIKNDLRGLILNTPVRVSKNIIWHSTYFTLPYRWRGLNVLTMHDMTYELFPRFFTHPLDGQFRAYKRKCIEKADAIICVSQSTADDLCTYYDFAQKKPIYVIHNACDDNFCQIPDVSTYYQAPTQKDFLLYVGGRQHYKNFAQFLKVYSAWHLNTKIDLVVVGEPWNNTELNLIRDSHLERKIHLLTKVADRDLCYLYNLALAFVYPSLYEGFGLPLLEAMRCGCPIVASKIPSSVEVAGECAVYFEPNDFNSFLNALTMAIDLGRNSKQVRSGLGRSHVFSWDRCAKMTLEVYSDLLARSPASMGHEE